MTALRPGPAMKALTLNANTGIADATLADVIVGRAQCDMLIHYIDVITHDANATFTGGALTLEYEATLGGSDVEIDAITVAANTTVTTVAYDDLTTAKVPAGAYFLVTTAAAFDNDGGFTIVLWYTDRN